MLIIKIGKKENINSALKRFKRKVSKTKMIKELRKRKNFVKPSELRRKQLQQAKYSQKFLNENEN